jgi:hypothetical protein
LLENLICDGVRQTQVNTYFKDMLSLVVHVALLEGLRGLITTL